MWGWLCGTVVLVCGTWGGGSYLYNPFHVCLLFCLYHHYILLISLEIFLFVSFFGSVTDNTARIYSELQLNCFQLAFSISTYFSLQDSKYIDILS